MTALWVELRLDAPTCIAQRPTSPGQVTTSLGYISGTALRGAIAARWLAGRTYDELRATGEDAAFRWLFLGDEVRFGMGRPITSPSKGSKGATHVVPQTAWAHKRRGGWCHDGDDGVHEVLTRLLRDTPADRSELDDLERLGQEFALVEEASGAWRSLAVPRRLITRTAINPSMTARIRRTRGLASEGQLYTFEAMEAGQHFGATITGPDDALDELRARILQEESVLALGRRRSTGDGAARITWVETESQIMRDVDDIADQAMCFSQRSGAAEGVVYLPVTLESDMVLRDNYLLPNSSGEIRETLGRYLPGAPETMELYRAIQRTRWIGGWDMIRGVPRSPQLAVQLGSVWVYRVPHDDLRNAIAWWLKAERQGLGEQRNQGFGCVRLLHPLHAEDRNPW